MMCNCDQVYKLDVIFLMFSFLIFFNNFYLIAIFTSISILKNISLIKMISINDTFCTRLYLYYIVIGFLVIYSQIKLWDNRYFVIQ